MTAIAAEFRPTLGMSVVGGLLSADLLERLRRGDRELGGLRPEDYGLAARETLGEAASREWEYLTGAYRTFRDKIDAIEGEPPLLEETRQYWLTVLLQHLGFGRVSRTQGGFDAEGRHFPISHLWESTPIHLLGWNVDLDKKSPGVAGAAQRAPQSMTQDFLNSSPDHLWGILSNGRALRVLRDSTQLVGAAYLEFDLEAIFEGELYADFAQLFMLAHSSRFEAPIPEDGTEPNVYACPLERWRAEGIAAGERARDKLRENLKEAIERLGTGFVLANPHVAAALADGPLSKDDFRQELLRLAYQLIFCFVTEDRGVLLDPDAAPDARERYERYFSTKRLRTLATRRVGDRHVDLWRTQAIVLNALGADDGHPALALPGLGGLFFRPEPRYGYADEPQPEADWRPYPDFLRDCELRNDALLGAVRALATFRNPRSGRLDTVDFQHLGAEELGSVYESLLELHGDVESDGSFILRDVAGNQRKTTGSYYTPDPLIQNLLDTALDPVIDRYAKSHIPADLLNITVCDPACGSGAFLVAAARRIAKRYAELTDGDDEPTPNAIREAMRQVVAKCVYGVDLNPLAAELAKVSLWLESVVPGKPLAFLDAHIKVGNSLLGVTPKLQRSGIPDGAFKPLGDDDRKLVAWFKKENKKARDYGKDTLLFEDDGLIDVSNHSLRKTAQQITGLPSDKLPQVREQIRRNHDLNNSPDKGHKKMLADAWCAAFVWPIRDGAPEPIKTDTLKQLDEGARLPEAARTELKSITSRYQFFHWHLEFPEVFVSGDDEHADTNTRTDWRGGFTCVLGNPPWERVKIQEKEYFAVNRPEIAGARNAAERKKLIQKLEHSPDEHDRALFRSFHDALRESAGTSDFLRGSGRYPTTGQGDVNTYAVFAETARTVVAGHGYTGQVLPTGIATDATTAKFFGSLVRGSRLAAFLEFENEAFLLSKDVDHRVRFCMMTACGWQDEVAEARFAFSVRYLADLPDRTFTMPPEAIAKVNPNTGTAPVFATRRDAEIVLDIYDHVGQILWRDTTDGNPWGLSFLRMFDMATDAESFRTREQLESDGWKLRGNIFTRAGERLLPLVEAKMIHHYDHRYGTYEGQTEAQANMGTLPRLTPEAKRDPAHVTLPRYWVEELKVVERLLDRDENGWLLGWRDICRSSDERTIIPSPIPTAAVGDKFLLMFPGRDGQLLAANMSTFVVDYVARQKFAGTSFKYYQMKQLPILPPKRFEQETPWDPGVTLDAWITPRVKELTYTAWDMEPFARDLGDKNPPYVWDDDRRFWLRTELDAAFFHLYGIARDDVSHILGTFGAFQRNDSARFDRTRTAILDLYDTMTACIEKGAHFGSSLTPPPGEAPRHHADTRPDWLDG